MADFWIRQGDTSPSIKATLKDVTGALIDLTSAESVSFHMADRQYRSIVSASAFMFDREASVVSYNWQAGDTDEAGEFYAEFQVVYGDGAKETFPSRGYITIRIERQLG